jgi:hypothetical protein
VKQPKVDDQIFGLHWPSPCSTTKQFDAKVNSAVQAIESVLASQARLIVLHFDVLERSASVQAVIAKCTFLGDQDNTVTHTTARFSELYHSIVHKGLERKAPGSRGPIAPRAM